MNTMKQITYPATSLEMLKWGEWGGVGAGGGGRGAEGGRGSSSLGVTEVSLAGNQ